MNPERWQEVKRFYSLALEVESSRRRDFLEKECGGDESLRKEVERLLERQATGEDLFGAPALDVAARAVAQDRKDEPLPDYAGRSLLHYRIAEKIGEGGMGVVYKARDTHLDRLVAIKVLPAEATSDVERKRRFIQEAKAASALSHPNIIDIHDINSDAGVDFIVMEHVAGTTLDRRIGRKGMRIVEALKCAVQIADALAAAHAAGIVHRDLKPDNIMVTETGLVKVLDFGLAKLTQPLEGEVSGTVSSMESLTGKGRIMGTVAYMSPEQAEGKAVDARSDIFSFGSVLYEMLTGRPAFQGDSTISTLSAILNKDAAPLSAEIPRDLERIVTRCLRKDAGRRIQHMDDVKLALEELKEDSVSGRSLVAPPVSRRVSTLKLTATVLVLVILTAAGWYWLTRQHPGEPEAQLTPVPLTSYPGFEVSPSFSPDGTQVAFEWCPEGRGANCDIYIKQIGVEEPPFQLTTDPAVDFSPAWSPDGQFIAFLRKLSPTSVALMIIPQRGGKERPLAESIWNAAVEEEDDSFLAWTPDSRGIVFPSVKPPAGLFLLHIETREIRRLTTTPAVMSPDYAPTFSPDGRALVFTRGYGEVRYGLSLLHLAPDYMPQREPERVGPIGRYNSHAAWLPDGSDIVFVSGLDGLWRMPVSTPANPRRLAFASELAFMPALSRQGNRLAYAVGRHDENIWRVDLRGSDSGTPVRFISSTRGDVSPAYSPDGKRIAFASARSGSVEIWLCDSDGSNPSKLTSIGGLRPRWSPDGRSIAFSDDTNTKSYITSVNGGAPRPLSTGSAYDKFPTWSRDGQSVYFGSNRSGSWQIWKMPVTGGEAVQITPAGDRDLPQESPDGKFLYYQKGWPTQCSVWRMAVGGGEESVVLDSVHCDGGWTVWQKGIYFFRPADEQARSDLCLYEFASGNTRKISTIERPVVGWIAASPDGRTILYPQVDESGSDLMLVENFR